jgi:tetratricopeptide (TPR) repeat protein
MGAHDWYRNTEWDEEGKQSFLARIGRSRGIYNKAQYLRIQASYIAVSDIDQSIELLMMIVNDYPDESQLSLTHSQIAECFIKLGKVDAAIYEFRKSFEAMRNYPKEKNFAYASFSELVLNKGLAQYYEEAVDVLNEFNTFLYMPKYKYEHHSLLALLLFELGKVELAKEYSLLALEAAKATTSGIKYHPKIGIVEGDVDSRIKEIANA